MTKAKTKRGFDCVALKRRAQAKIYADTKDLPVAEQIAYFRRRAKSGPLAEWWERVLSRSSDVSPLMVREKRGRYGK